MRYDFWCFDPGVERVDGEIDRQVIAAVSNAFGMIFDVETGRREDFDAMTERETISAQNIGFLGVAGGVKESEILVIDFDWLIDGVSINAGSLDGGGVAKDVDVSIVVIVASSTFDVEKDVDIAATDFDVDSASSFDVDSAGFAGFFA